MFVERYHRHLEWKSRELASSGIGFRKRLCNRMWQVPMVLISTRLIKGARGISSSTRVLTTRLPCEDLRPIVWGTWACHAIYLWLYALRFLRSSTYILAILTEGFPTYCGWPFDIKKSSNISTTHGLRVRGAQLPGRAISTEST